MDPHYDKQYAGPIIFKSIKDDIDEKRIFLQFIRKFNCFVLIKEKDVFQNDELSKSFIIKACKAIEIENHEKVKI